MVKKIESKLRSNIWSLIILTISGSLIYALPYFRSYYYDAYVETYNLTNTQMGTLGAMFGVFGMISYLFGGIVADFISPKKLISASLVLTGLAGFSHLFVSNYSMLLIIYLVWGFTSLFAFWPSLVKGIRSLAGSDEQSKAYGFMEGGRGIMNAVHLAVALAIFNYISSKANDAAGIKGVITFYSIVMVVLGVLVFILLKDPGKTDKSERFNFKQLLTVIKMPQVWILSLILCATYTMNISYMYFSPFATSAFGIATAGGALITIMADYVRPVGSIGGGFLADRVGRGRLMTVGFLVMAVCTFAITFLHSITLPVFVVICALLYLGMYSNYGLVFSFMEEGGIPMEVSGTAIGLISTLGYLPEVICPLVFGRTIDGFGDAGYRYYFIGVGVIMIIGIFALSIWNRSLKKKKAL